MKKGAVLILGATSSIARGVAEELAKQKHPLILASRDKKELLRIASDLSIRFDVSVETAFFDAQDTASHGSFFDSFKGRPIDGALISFGHLGKKDPLTYQEQEEIIRVNYLGAVSALTLLSPLFITQKRGFIIALSSVAGDRGRGSNFVYGSAKGGLNIYLQGLRNKLYPLGVHVMTVKPGFVDTAMTFGLSQLFCVADPKDVGRKIVLSLKKKKNIVYVPGFWRWIMLAVRAIPEAIFKCLKI